MNEVEAVQSLNSKFYTTFAAGDFDTMNDLWAKHHNLAVIHPGWPALHGYEQVMQSWQRIIGAQGPIDITCADENVYIMSSVAFVICTEILGDTKLAATNIFIKEDGQWKIAHHHASPVQNIDVIPDVIMH